MTTTHPTKLLGLSARSEEIRGYVANLARLVNLEGAQEPAVKAYSDALYANYYSLGVSFLFVSLTGAKPLREEDLKGDSLLLDSIDIFNIPNGVQQKKTSSSPTYSSHPEPNLVIPLLTAGPDDAAELQLKPSSTGKDIVECLGEPNRKGGGEGPASGSIGIWCEWSKKGVMVEFGGDEARGPQAWERGKDATWKTMTLFRPNK